MKLFYSQQECWDMPLGGDSDQKQIPHWFGNLVWIVVGGLCKLLFRYRVDGRKNLQAFKEHSGVLVVSNHTSYLDVAFLYLSARPKQWIRLLGRDSLFTVGGGILGWMFSHVGAFPIKRNTSDRQALKRAARDLKAKEVVGIFPEGTRRNKSKTTPALHSGAALIAKMGNAPILPMAVRNAELIKQKGKFVRFPKVTMEFGDPVLLSDFDWLPKAERLDACTWYAMRQTFSMFYRVNPEEVDMVTLFPESKDYSEVFAEHPIPKHTASELVAADEFEAAK